jgi:hypothetical protein
MKKACFELKKKVAYLLIFLILCSQFLFYVAKTNVHIVYKFLITFFNSSRPILWCLCQQRSMSLSSTKVKITTLYARSITSGSYANCLDRPITLFNNNQSMIQNVTRAMVKIYCGVLKCTIKIKHLHEQVVLDFFLEGIT